MKNIVLCIFICIVLAGCDDAKIADCHGEFSSSPVADMVANPAPPKYPCDYLKAHKNGSEWTVWATTSFYNDTLYVHGLGNEESMRFSFRFDGTGTYEIETKGNPQLLNGNAYYYTTLGGDVIISNYHLAKKTTVEIVEYNETEKIIKGNFEFLFKELSGSSMSFQHGTFSVHLPD